MKIFEKLINNQNNLKRAKEFEKDYIKINYDRLIPILSVLYAAEWIIYFFSEKFLDIGHVILYFLIFLTFMLPVLIITYKNFDYLSVSFLKILFYFSVWGIIAFGIALVFETQGKSDLVHMFMMVCLGVASLAYMPFKESIFIIGIPTLIFFFGIEFYQNDISTINVLRLNTVIFNFIVLMLSYNLFSMKIKDFILHDEMRIKNQALLNHTKIDQMTSLYNHETIFSLLDQQIEKSKEQNTEIIIMLLDIDNFKLINDNFGHLEGDKVIMDVANVLKETIDSSNFIGRYGGEEFLVVMPESTIEKAKNAYFRFRSIISQKYRNSPINLTLSCGIAQSNGQSLNDFFKSADRRLYIAKQTGKDKCVYNEIGEKDLSSEISV